MRNRFDLELETLNNELIEMGILIENAIERAVEALVKQSTDLAEQTLEIEQDIDDKERMIEQHCMRLLLQQHPVATDLRLISAALKIITDMERIGDQAADIAQITIRLVGQEYIKNLYDIQKMAQETIKMVKDIIDAFVVRDINAAAAIIAYDDVVDDLFNLVKEELIDLIREDPNNGEQAVDLLMIAKYFERIGDHAVNIAQWVVFAISGYHPNKNPL